MGSNEYSKTKLSQLIESKFRTAAIGTLASVEDSFGALWGHGKEEYDLSETQVKNRAVWQQLRTEILDKIHDQKRQILHELDQYGVEWNRYQIQFIPRNS